MRASQMIGCVMGAALLALMVGTPFVYYRYSYGYGKRLRPVEEGKVYRSGCMTADGFANAIQRLGIRTVFNLMEEAPDPSLPAGFFDTTAVQESELCARHGAKMVSLTVDLIDRNRIGKERPAAIEMFLDLMDRPETYPVLIHCRAGLHRTGVIAAVYRMEYDGWTPHEAVSELKSHGFGEFAATAANDYIAQYLLAYQPGQRSRATAKAATVPARLMAFPKPARP